jgi:phosphatidylglycerol lysyltransferase
MRKRFPFVYENRKLIAQFIFAFLFIAIGVWFIKHEHSEIGNVRQVLGSTIWQYLLVGLLLILVYIFLQGSMYKMALASLHSKVPLFLTVVLYLKRYFISVFLPAGGVASLAFFTSDIEKRGITKTKIHFASSLFIFIGVLSLVIVSVPILFYSLIDGRAGFGEWFGMAALILVILALYLLYHSVFKKQHIYHLIIRIFPRAEVFLDDLISHTISTRHLAGALFISIFVDLTGIVLLYLAMLSLRLHPSLFAAMMGYVMSVLFLAVSPFMRGLGAVEVSMTYILSRFGFSNVEAVSITLMYRFFAFWLLLLAGALSFLININKLLMRVIPAFLIFILGFVNIISVITPALADRLQRLQNLIPVDAIDASNYFVFIAGFFMLITAAFLLKGLRNAWWIALILSLISVVGHITKAIDYEEASVALLVMVMLLVSRKEYYVKGNSRLRFVGIGTALFAILAIMVYGTVGFYYLDKRYLNIDFSFLQSVQYTIQNIFLAGSNDLTPHDSFTRHFILSIKLSGASSILFLIFTTIRPLFDKKKELVENIERAHALVTVYGTSALDYFKVYRDKLIFAPEELNAFLAYRISGNFAVVLENPVGEKSEQIRQCIIQFDKYCYNNDLRSVYYRVPEESISMYRQLGKKSLLLGQEGVVDLNTFTLEGSDRKSLRNSVNKTIEKGYKAFILDPPIKDGVLQKLKAVSDEWLINTGRKEIVFSQGMFIWEELKSQTILTVENAEEKIIAFVNIVPDYTKKEGTYDLMRKTADAPNGVMDFILIELFNYFKSKDYSVVNLGFAPMSGLEEARAFHERSMKFAYERLKSFSHYKGLRDYKEKFSPAWHNKYLCYSHDYDLLQIPVVLTRVIKPNFEY